MLIYGKPLAIFEEPEINAIMWLSYLSFFETFQPDAVRPSHQQCLADSRRVFPLLPLCVLHIWGSNRLYFHNLMLSRLLCDLEISPCPSSLYPLLLPPKRVLASTVREADNADLPVRTSTHRARAIALSDRDWVLSSLLFPYEKTSWSFPSSSALSTILSVSKRTS